MPQHPFVTLLADCIATKLLLSSGNKLKFIFVQMEGVLFAKLHVFVHLSNSKRTDLYVLFTSSKQHLICQPYYNGFTNENNTNFVYTVRMSAIAFYVFFRYPERCKSQHLHCRTRTDKVFSLLGRYNIQCEIDKHKNKFPSKTVKCLRIVSLTRFSLIV